MAAYNRNEYQLKSQNWRRALLPANVTLGDLIRNLEDTAFQIALIVDSNEKLLGTVTDGDVRRGILRGIDMSKSVKSLIQVSPIVASPDMGIPMALELMRANKIHQLPVVDKSKRVVGLHFLDDLISPPSRSNTIVIMAGGLGTRLRPHTENCPKPMLPVLGKPILEHIIERARSEGFTNFLLAIHYLGHLIERHFGDGSHLQVNIEYIREDTPLGTAGALGLMSSRFDTPFMVTNGDVLTDIRFGDLLDFHSRNKALATMAVRQHKWQNPFGVVHTRGIEIIGFEEKPISLSHINAGVYALEPNVLNYINKNEHCDMPALFRRLQENSERTIVYPIHEPWLDIGRPDDYKKANSSNNGD